MKPEFMEKFEKFFKGCDEISGVAHERNGFTFPRDKFEYKVGRRYIKVIQGYSVHSFVDMKEGSGYGNVLKAAGFNKPAKGARGNIFDEKNGLGRMGEYGPAYNR